MKLTLDAEPAELLAKSGDLVLQLAKQLSKYDARLAHVARYAERVLGVSAPIEGEALAKGGAVSPMFVMADQTNFGTADSILTGALGPALASNAMAGALAGSPPAPSPIFRWPAIPGQDEPGDAPPVDRHVQNPYTLTLVEPSPEPRPVTIPQMSLEHVEPDLSMIQRLERIAVESVAVRAVAELQPPAPLEVVQLDDGLTKAVNAARAAAEIVAAAPSLTGNRAERRRAKRAAG